MNQEAIKISSDPMRTAQPVRARTELEVRIADAISDARSRRMEQRGGAPDGIPEITRELTMLRGALHGVQQRIGELAAELHPIMDPKLVAMHLTGEEAGGPGDDFVDNRPAVVTEMGREIQEMQRTVSEFEATLTFIRHAVSL